MIWIVLTNFFKVCGIGLTHLRINDNKFFRKFVKKAFLFSLIFAFLSPQFSFLIPTVQAASSPWTQTDWSGGSGQTSWSDNTKFDSSSNVTTSTAGQATLTITSNWCSNSYCNSSWPYRKKITFDNTDANLGVTSENLTDFPVLVKLSSSNIDYSKTNNDGSDIRFTDTDGSDLAYEIESWDETGTSWVWVKVPQIDINSSSDYIYLYYGNSSATNHEQATSVWDSNFKMVQHLKETSGTTTYDSTSNGNNGTKVSATEPNPVTSGQIDGAQEFDGSDDYINLPTSSNLTFTTAYTLSTWVNLDAARSYNLIFCRCSGSADDIELYQAAATQSITVAHNRNNTGTFKFSANNGGSNSTGAWGAIATSSWTHLVLTYTSGTWRIYKNGALAGSSSSNADPLNTSGGKWQIGATTNTTTFGASHEWDGKMDEVRISNAVRSTAWIAASYKSESDAFSSFSSEEQIYSSTPGSLTSSIFDTEYTGGAAWGTLTYSATTPSNTSVTVKARTSNSSSMTGATTFSSCTAITSDSDISSNDCVTDSHRYIQYQLSLANTDSISTPTSLDISIAFSTFDSTAPSISLTALSPDPNTDNTPALTGTATDAVGTVSNVQFQMNSTSGSWNNCTADDGVFDESSEVFTCSVSSALSDGSHTMYVRATDSNSNTTASGSESSDTFITDTGNPSVSVTAISPDPRTDTTPTISGTATDTGGTISTVQFQVDSTTDVWSTCTATDETYDSSSENFSCTTAALSDGSHTIYIRAVDNASNTSSNATDSFTVDATSPASFDLDSPGDKSYTNDERTIFTWKASSDATAGLSKYVLEIDNPPIGDSQPSGDFTIDSIPTSRTNDYVTSKYVIRYKNFADSDSSNDYISVYTKSHSDWGSSENDGKVREGKIGWKVKAVDHAGNETSSSRTLFVDKSDPNVELTQINNVPFSSSIFSTTDKTPTLRGKITDFLAGSNNNDRVKQDENGPQISSGPKQVDVKVEKKTGLGYKPMTLYTINMDKPLYSCDNKILSDNSKQKCDKYLPFEYTSKENLELGTYKITLSGKDKAGNTSAETTLTLHVTTLAQITTPEEKKIIEAETKPLAPEQIEKVKEELEITKAVEPSALDKTGIQFSQNLKNILHITSNFIASVRNQIGQGIRFTRDTADKALTFVADKTEQALAVVRITSGDVASGMYNRAKSTQTYIGQTMGNGAKAVGQGLAWTEEKVRQGVSTLAQETGTLLASISLSIENTGKAVGDEYTQFAHNAPGVSKTILTGIEQGVSSTANGIASITSTVVNSSRQVEQNIASTVGDAAGSVISTASIITQNTGNATVKATSSLISGTTTAITNTRSTIAGVTHRGVSSTKKGIAYLAFTIGEKTDDISHGVGTAIIKIGYLFVPEPTNISNVNAVALSPTSVKITWTTNHPATGKVNWGYEDGIYTFEQQTDKRTNQHEFILTNLKSDTEYHYEVMSQNRNYVYDANRKFRTLAQ